MDSQQNRVLVQLRDLILKGEFVPGERLAEIPLAEKLGASRTPCGWRSRAWSTRG
jgi:GntR family transcriptional regulator of vanillate catabolism